MSTEDARKLFVAGLPDTITEDILRQLFEATGGTVVDVSIPRDRATGRPRGFGFVTLATSDEALAARDSLDGSVQAGRSISVRPFQAEPPRREGGPGPMGPGGGPSRPPMQPPAPPAPDRTLYVGNLPYDCSEQEVEELIAGTGAGAVSRVNLPMDPDGRKRGFGFVTMESADAARAALEGLRGVDMRGRRLVVNIAHPKGERPPRSDMPGPGPGFDRPRPGGPGSYGGGGGSYGGPPRGPSSSGGPSGPPGDRPMRPGGGFGGTMPPPDPPRRTFDDRRRPTAARTEAEPDGRGARKRPKAERERNRRANDWEDDYLDEDE